MVRMMHKACLSDEFLIKTGNIVHTKYFKSSSDFYFYFWKILINNLPRKICNPSRCPIRTMAINAKTAVKKTMNKKASNGTGLKYIINWAAIKMIIL